ncbi:bifunctional 3-demethylubiquinone-9 3-methyltransferase/ 2-octaprenyl-6-hydroxy phenol methylase [Oxobacter pfennigii]|uniref:Bifunctional 3-demethylubiquinone-9 3-methyltransferase/ 2-octaprenyl-6-hydroxy phenol methylase n=1 Tax=Oxobacter pfennigii TaxID=36849 RepID=A0A0P8WYF9_9CLOT|nr:class I SAM-dependent methyltransferase [Oxobacter pfennigii]KPU43423.1 bifunctional 3-demethylubiquinone-9 3-methyltransferase/ 2-octaprenyl-6-hydroxy phenol methylase [Oxobacter pfennigii]
MTVNSDYTELSQLIISVQSEIVDSCENLHYRKFYMQEERDYWDSISKWMYEEKDKRKIDKCLDIGCGYGTLLIIAQKIYGSDIYGIDFLDSYLSKDIIEKYNLNFKICNAETDTLPWECRFDIIFLTEVIEHFNFNVIPTLIKIRESLSDDGVFYLSTPDAEWYGKITEYYKDYKDMPSAEKNIPTKDCHIYVFNKNELLEIFNDVGFEVEDYQLTNMHHFNFKLRKKGS